MRKLIFIVVGSIWITFSGIASQSKITDSAHFYTKHSFDVLKYNLEINIYQCFISPYPKTFSANLTITAKADSGLNRIKLNALNGSMTIESVRINGLTFLHASDTLTIDLDRYYNTGEIFNVRIFYHHKNVTDYGFYASYGTVFTDSPPEGARKWLPCWDRPSDKATWELKAIVKSPALLVSNGLPVGDPVSQGDSITYHWKSDDQISTYLICFSSKINFLKHQTWYHPEAGSTDSIPIMIYSKPGEDISLIDSMIVPVTDFFASKFGKYPFEKIGFATMNPQFSWGGMENQTIVHLRPNGYADLNLIAHEHSHQWFGDLVTCGTWSDIWLNEGFATYCQNLWVEHNEGTVAYQASMNSIANSYLSGNPGWPLYQPSWAIHTPSVNSLYSVAISYNKGACVLYMLRHVIGDSLFFSVLKEFATDTRYKFGNVYTQDFIEKVNQITGQDYRWFFNEWVYGPNHPSYVNTYQIDSLGAEGWKVSIMVRQNQTNAGIFKMPVDFKILFEDGTDTTLTDWNEQTEKLYGYQFIKKPKSVVFDPNRKIIIKQALTIYHVNIKSESNEDLLDQNFPNPFTFSTTISYHILAKAKVKLSVIDTNGQIVDQLLNHQQTPGLYNLEYTNYGLKPGVYQILLEQNDIKSVRKMVRID